MVNWLRNVDLQLTVAIGETKQILEANCNKSALGDSERVGDTPEGAVRS
jgi:hypothetical protein